MSEYVRMESLPEDHPMRTKPLGEIGAEFWNKRRDYGGWALASEHRVGGFCYNQLEGNWLVFNHWRVKQSCAAPKPTLEE